MHLYLQVFFISLFNEYTSGAICSLKSKCYLIAEANVYSITNAVRDSYVKRRNALLSRISNKTSVSFKYPVSPVLCA